MKVETMAKEVHDEIGKDIQGIHPWQYQNLNLVSINYEAILEDILTYWNQDARFREGFKVEGNNIYIPNFFEKVNGIHKNKNEYIEFIQNLKETKNTLVVDTYFDFDDILDYANSGMNNCDSFLYEKEEYEKIVYDLDNLSYYPISRQNILKHKFLGYSICNSHYTFNNLTSSKQEQLIKIMDKISKEKKDEWGKKELEKFYSICFSLPESVTRLINNFDYSFEVPKILCVTDKINWDTTVLLMILNEFAFDILLLQPSGKSTIEKYMDVNELSLGYFVEEFDIQSNMLTKKEKKEKEQKEKDALKERKRRNRNNSVKSILPDILFNGFNIGLVVLAIILIFNIDIGWINTLIELGLIITLVIEISIIDIINNIRFKNSNFFCGVVIASISALIILLGIRFIIWLPTEDIKTHTHNGYQQIEEQETKGNNNFVMKYKKDAILREGEHTMYCYIENNSQNTLDMYFELYVGNTKIYESSNIKPLTYVPKVALDDCKLPIGDTKIKIKFYTYDEDAKADETIVESTETENKGTFLGEGSFTCHVYDDYKSYKEASEKYKLEDNE